MVIRRLAQQNIFVDDVPTALKKLKQEQVEITLGNHPPQNCTLEKRQWMLDHPGENPFLDPACWQAQLAVLKENCEKAIALGY